MPTDATLTPDDLRRVMVVYRRLLVAHREHLDELNVYPVPDADTGANLGATLGAVVDALPAAGTDPGMAEVCRAVRRGAILGARGASGVITSQVLAALANAFEDRDRIDGAGLADALDAARSAAYRAVLTPAEGTILTVLREAARAAGERVSAGDADLNGVLDAARAAAAETLVRTPEMLPALKAAGVVDAGGSGLVLLFDALLHVASGRELPAPPVARRRTAPAAVPDGMPRYEVVVRLAARAEVMEEFRAVWDGLGNESTVIVEGRGEWVCHIHTSNPEAATEAARAAGEIHDVQVNDLVEQVTRLRAAHADHAAVVAFAPGPALQQRFLDMGAAGVVAGGAGRNPSTAELLQAVDATGAPEVLVLPNDPDVLAAARQVPTATTRRVVVIPSCSMSAGMAAMRAYDPGRPHGDADGMRRAAERVSAGGVTRAARDADSPAGRIEAGTWIVRMAEGSVTTAASAADALRSLVDGLADGAEPVRVEILLGRDAAREVAEAGCRHATGRWPWAQVEIVDAGQPLYPYLVGVERAGPSERG